MQKFKFWYEHKALTDWHWRWIITADVDRGKRARREFLDFMHSTFGNPGNAFSVRWCDLGAEIYFHNQKDYFKFKMFHTYDE